MHWIETKAALRDQDNSKHCCVPLFIVTVLMLFAPNAVPLPCPSCPCSLCKCLTDMFTSNSCLSESWPYCSDNFKSNLLDWPQFTLENSEIWSSADCSEQNMANYLRQSVSVGEEFQTECFDGMESDSVCWVGSDVVVAFWLVHDWFLWFLCILPVSIVCVGQREKLWQEFFQILHSGGITGQRR